jgi:hypothetical protein
MSRLADTAAAVQLTGSFVFAHVRAIAFSSQLLTHHGSSTPRPRSIRDRVWHRFASRRFHAPIDGYRDSTSWCNKFCRM